MTGVPRFSTFLSNDEVAQSNISSIASRSRKSVAQIQKAPTIKEIFSYPRSIVKSIESAVNSHGLSQFGAIENNTFDTFESVASEDEGAAAFSSFCEMPNLQNVLKQNPKYLTYQIRKSMTCILTRSNTIYHLKKRVSSLHDNSMCPMIQAHAAFSAEERFAENAEDEGYRDILTVTDQVYLLPDSGERVSLLRYLLHWKQASYRLEKYMGFSESMFLALLDRWDDLFELRTEIPPENVLIELDIYEEDWAPAEPSEEERNMVATQRWPWKI